MSLGAHDDPPEDPQERASFDRTTKTLFNGRPLRAIASALTQFSKANPEQGSLAKMLAIYSNEIALADKNYAYQVAKNAKLEKRLAQAETKIRRLQSQNRKRDNL
jgi:septal ring factor EnvC (AmiA/AmiB activator)